MNSNLILFIYELTHNGIKIWLQDEKIKLYVPENLSLTETQQVFIKNNKNSIVECLRAQRIYSKNYDILILNNNLKQLTLSFSQERLWFIEKYEGGTNAYNIPMVFRLSNDVKLEVLENSIRSVVNRQEILRTLVKENEEGTGYQLVLDEAEYKLEIARIKIDNKLQFKQVLEKQVNHVYDLSSDLPIKVCLYEVTDVNSRRKQKVEYYLSIVVHHIAFDGWSVDIFFKELQAYYNYYLNQLRGIEASLELPKLSIQYKDFAFWQRNYFNNARLEQQLSYWRDKLVDYESLSLITDKPRPKQIDYRGSNICFEIEEELSIALRKLAKELEVSLYSVLLAAYYLVLRSYTNQNDIVIGTPVSNRHYSQVENLIGFFVNTLALRSKIDSTDLIKNYIQRVGKEVAEAQEYQDLPFEKLVEELNIEKDTSRHPIFQIMFGVQSFGNKLASNTKDNNLLLEPYRGMKDIYNIAKFDISTFIDDSQSVLKGNFNYAVSLYKEETIVRFIETYINILKQIGGLVGNRLKQVKIKDISYLNKKQSQQIVYEWNKTKKEYPADKTIHSLFEEQVRRIPDNIAVVYEEKKLTYRELNEKSNQLAHYIKEKYNIQPDDLVALCLDRSEHMLIAILAVLKAGGAYVPMDPSYPDERIKYIVEDTKPKAILSNEVYEERLNNIIRNIDEIESRLEITSLILPIDKEEIQQKLTTESVTELETVMKSTNLAYVIYTSGTTGNPKGVMIEHRGVVNTVLSLENVYDFTKGDRITAFTSYVFDVSASEFLIALFKGASLYLLNESIKKDALLISNYIKNNSINYIYLPPVLLSFLPKIKYEALQGIIYAGEPCDVNTGKYWSENYKLYNFYGPTEMTIYASGKQVINGDTNLIGTPISNTECYVLDTNLSPLPIGAIGELYIGGVGLARGYLNRPDLTADRFIKNPFQTEEEKADTSYGPNGCNARLYKTGDLVRWLPDGNLEYIGRNDFQVKIRGYRIELGEIETALSGYGGVKQAVVLSKEHAGSDNTVADGSGGVSKYLAGYYVSDKKLDEEGIRRYLESKLPEYMVPTALVYLEKLPLTINGKLDRKALPDPEFSSDDNYTPPRNKLEAGVCRIWAEVLGIPQDKVGISDNFFRLGGDSIVSIQLVSRIRQRLGLNLSIKDIFSYKTIERLCDNVLSKNLADKDRIQIKTEQGMLSGEVRLLPIQRWFFDNDFAKASHWNQSFLIKAPELDIDKLNISLKKLFEHHDAFRLKYKRGKGGKNNHYTQYYDVNAKVEYLRTLDIKTLGLKEGSEEFQNKLQEILTNWQSDFNLESGPLYSVGYIYGYEDGSSKIYFAVHHLIVDAVSWRILVDDLKNIYAGNGLRAKGSSYRQWVDTVAEYGSNHHQEEEYWNKVLADYESGRLRGNLVNKDSKKNHATAHLSKELTQDLLQNSNKTYNTQINDLLLTAFSYALFEVTGTKINHLVLEGHGREEIDSSIDITRTVGWFTSMYPARLEMQEEIGSSIKCIKESLRQIPDKGIGYGALFGYEIDKLPKISFNYLGQFTGNDGNQTASELSKPWHITGEFSGISVDSSNYDHNIINVNGLVVGNCLEFSIDTKLSKRVTDKLASIFTEKLKEVIAHTVNQERTYLTVSDIDYVVNQEYLDKLQATREIEALYLANSLQQGFIYHALNQGDVDDAYRVQLIWEYNNELDIDKLKQAWRQAQKGFSSLRLSFAWEEELVQIIDKEGQLHWNYIDLSTITDEELQAEQIRTIQQKQDRLESYDLAAGSLFKLYLIKQKNDLYSCIFSSHHSILDGWSNRILLGYVHDTYLNLLDNKQISSSPEHSYKEAQKYIQQHQQENREYWDNYVGQIEEKLDLSGLLKGNLEDKNTRISEYKQILEPAEKTLTIELELYNKLKDLSQKEGVTFNAMMQYAWHKMLSVYGNSSQTVVGVTVSGRNLPVDDIENSVGLYINTLPLVVTHSEPNEKTKTSKNSIIEAIKNLQDNINEINTRSYANLASLQKDGRRLFDSLFVYENYPSLVNEEQQNRLKINFIKSIEKLDYPLGAIVYNTNNTLIFKLKYASEIFDPHIIEQIPLIIRKLLEQIIENANQQESNLYYLNDEQYQKIAYEWNKTKKEYPADKTIHSLFEEQVRRTPDNIAVVYEDIKLTYRELNEKANQLAYYIKEKYNIQPDDLVALCLDRSEHMLIAILAVLKAGGAYVPMDPSYPDERIKYIVEDTKPKAILSNEIYEERLKNIIRNIDEIESRLEITSLVIAVDKEEIQQELTTEPVANTATVTRSTNLAYVIYTSGTTGNPKGVMIEHQGIVNRIKWMNSEYPLKATDKILQKTSYVFDVSVWELFWAHWYGASIVFAKPEGHKDASYISSVIEQAGITITHFVPSMLSAFTNNLELSKSKDNLLPTLRYIFCSGETLSLSQVQNCYKLLPYIKLHNLYGPTEASIDVLYYDCHKDIKQVYIGKPIDNTSVYILDLNLQPLPIGAIGELYIGGAGLARGYLNKPELTREKFILNPFQTEEEKKDKTYGELGRNARLYKTGDLVRWLPDGNIEYIGRNDFQVKIRGYRIELGEIESALLDYRGIKQSVVIDKDHITNNPILNNDLSNDVTASGNKYLVGYYVSDNKLNEDEILNYLNTKLPEYMVPTVLVHIDKLPLTINGKLDRRALPDPEFKDRDNYVAPRNELESKLCQIWAEILGLPEDKVGICDDFFKLGGNSILAIRLVSKLNKVLSSSINISAIFKHKTINKLIYHLEHNTDKSIEINKAVINNVKDTYLSFSQERLWFIEKYEGGTNAYNISMIFKLSDDTKLEILESSIRSVVNRHEILRTLIKENEEGTGYQLVLDDKEYPLEIARIKIADKLELEQVLEKHVNHVYDLSSEYPIKIFLYELVNSGVSIKEKSEHYLSIIIHHIAFDGWSIDIFLKELQAYYNYYLNQLQGIETSLELPKLSIQYKDFALWQRNYFNNERLEQQLSYWRDKLDDYESLNLITDKPRPKQIDYRGDNVYFKLDKQVSNNLKELAKELKVSLYSLLLGAYYLMLKCYSNQDDIVIGTPIANRHYSQIENLIGFFVNTLALRVKIDSNSSIKEFIETVGQEVIGGQLHQDLPFEKLVDELKVEKDISRHPIFQVMFVIENNRDKFQNWNNVLEPYSPASNLYNVAKFDITTFIKDGEDGLEGNFNYAISLYSRTTIEGFIKTYTHILQQLVALAEDKAALEQMKIKDLSYLNQEQYDLIVNKWNETSKEYPADKTIHSLFEEQVRRTPDNIAVVYEDIKLTYRELNEKANQLAYYIKEKYNIQPDDLVALCLDRSEHMLIAILAVLKAGGAYVPMDPSYPDERIKYIVEDTKPKAILSNEVYEERLKNIIRDIGKIESGLEITSLVIAVDKEEIQQELTTEPVANTATVTRSTNLAYVIYTSGTTGNPKGVMIEHTGIVNTILSQLSYINSKEKILLFGLFNSYVFDISVSGIFMSLISGHKLYIANVSSQINISDYIYENKISITLLPSQILSLLDESKITSLKILFVGGEKIDKYKIKKLTSLSIIVLYEYGLTEVSIVSTCKKLSKKERTSNIGHTIFNTKCYILNNNLLPLPTGAIGELYIGGVGLARGYLNQPALTAEKFINNPFQTEEEKNLGINNRIYKTGDLVRWSPGGNIEFIGRNDFQVKIRGYRIELDEIESILASYKGIKQCVVLVKEHKNIVDKTTDNKYIIGYYLSENLINEEDLLTYLRSKLPEYMVPSVLVRLEKLPLTINGKLDRKALPDAEFREDKNSYLAPRNELEKKVCQIWAEIFGLSEDKVSIRDNFFRLGGNSLLAVRLVSKLNAYCYSNLSIADIFYHKSIESLLPQIFRSRKHYHAIIKLNNNNDKPNIFMIHPGAAGCEVYSSLATVLYKNFSCYGVESYNLYNKNKINNLNKLAEYYLKYIDNIMSITKQDTYILLGWSLGGQISLEIASILENRGITNIIVYLLDTILSDDHILKLNSKINFNKLEKELSTNLTVKGYDISYVKKVISTMPIERKLVAQKISSTLNNTNIVLFKAMCEYRTFAENFPNGYYEYLSTLSLNNIDKVINDSSNIKVIKLYNTHHGNILDRTNIIASKIQKFYATKKI